MARERWLVDGWELTQGTDRDVEYRTGLYSAPAAEGEDGNVSNRTGRIWRPKTHGPGSFTLAVWLGGASRAQAEALWDEMLRAVVHPHRLSVYERTLADGSIRRCDGDVVTALEPTPIGNLGMRLGIEVNVPAGYWRGVADADDVVALPTVAGDTSADLVLTSKARSTAPMEHLTYRIAGPVTNPRVADLTDGAPGEEMRYAGAVPAGATLVVNASTWQVTGEGFAPNIAALNFTGRRYLVVPAARPGRTPTVRFYGSATGAGTALTVRGREAFLL